MKNLVSKTFSRFALCCVGLFLVSAPLFYFITRHYYAEDMMMVLEAAERGHDIPPIDLERDIMEGIMLQFVLTFAIVSAALYVTLRFITLRMWLPFDDTLRKAEEFDVASGEMPALMPTDIREFHRLNRSLEKMMRHSRETFLIQKEFTENASHELQTPLAVTRSKLDLLLQENLDENTLAMIADLYNLNTRMEHLNRSLLLLAKIENGQYRQSEDVEPGDFIGSRTASYRLLLKPAQRLEFSDCRREARHLKANAMLLESLTDNLVVNAIRHTHEGLIAVTLTEHGLTVSNPSDGEPLDTEGIFRRFRQCDDNAGGNGLGLAIAKAICDYHGWEITYTHDRLHHRFAVRFS